MREILFRGKRIDNGEWVEGAYCKHDTVKICFSSDNPKTKHLIITDGFCDWGFEPPLTGCEVDPNTIGQYTGLTDKNGKRIFEGDIVRLYGGEEYEWVARVGMKRGCLVALSKDEWDFLETNTKACEIIGNIHDNPELLKGENEEADI